MARVQNKERNLELRAKIWDLRTQDGLTPTQISHRLGVSVKKVHEVLGSCRREVANRHKENLADYLADELEIIDSVIRRAADAFDRSIQNEETVEVSTDGSPAWGEGEEQGTKVKRTTKTKAGSPAYLSIILAAVAQKRDVLGLHESLKKAGNQVDGGGLALKLKELDELEAADHGPSSRRKALPCPQQG